MTRRLLASSLALILVQPGVQAGAMEEGAAKSRFCKSAYDLGYESSEATLEFELFLKRCWAPGMGRVDVKLRLKRCAETCESKRLRATCTPRKPCKFTVTLEHPLVEMADYRGDYTYKSRGPVIKAGVGTVLASCTSAGVAIGCV